MAFKMKVLNLQEVLRRFTQVFDTELSSGGVIDDLGDIALNRVKQQTRRGLDLKRDGSPQPPLSENYVRYRRSLAKGVERRSPNGNIIRPDPDFFRPNKSNLTLTGQLLRSLVVTKNKKNLEISVKPSGVRADGISNEDVARDLERQGRTFLGLDKTGIKLLKKRILDEIRRQIIKKRFSKR